jgi:hypothetical protein
MVAHPHYVIVYHLTGKPRQAEVLRVLPTLHYIAAMAVIARHHKENRMSPETIDWFQEEVALALKEADDPNTEWVSNEEAEASWAKQRAELLKRVAGKVS